MNTFTYEKLVQMRLPGMAKEYQRQMNEISTEELSFNQRLQLLVDAEYDNRHNNTIKRLMTLAKLSDSNASIETIHYFSDRNLNKSQIQELSTNHYIRLEQQAAGRVSLLVHLAIRHVVTESLFVMCDCQT